MTSIGLDMRKNSKGKGFTLVELLVVLAVIGVTSAIAAPSVSAWVQNYRAKTAARQLLTDLQFARMSAVSQKQNCTVTITPATATYTIQINGNTLGIPRQLSASTIGNNQPNPYYAPGVVLGANSAPNALVITFSPLGYATFSAALGNGTGEATLSQGGATPWNVIVTPVGGMQITGGPGYVL